MFPASKLAPSFFCSWHQFASDRVWGPLLQGLRLSSIGKQSTTCWNVSKHGWRVPKNGLWINRDSTVPLFHSEQTPTRERAPKHYCSGVCLLSKPCKPETTFLQRPPLFEVVPTCVALVLPPAGWPCARAWCCGDLQWPTRVESLSKTQQTTWLLPTHNLFSCQCCDHQLCVSCTIGFQRCTVPLHFLSLCLLLRYNHNRVARSCWRRCIGVLSWLASPAFQPFIEQARNLVDTAWSGINPRWITLLSVGLDDVICPRYVAWAAWVPGVVCQEYCCRPCPFCSGWPDCCWLTTCCSCSTWSTPPVSTSRTISTEVTRITTVKVSMFALSSLCILCPFL